MMIPSQAKNDSAFTVTIGGVDLCLTPSPGLSTDDTSAMPISLSRMSGGEIFIDLNGFVGTLTLALCAKKNHKSTNKDMDNESSEASTSPTSITIDTVPDPDGFESYLLDLIREILFDCGGITQCRQLGRNLCTSRGYHDASKSALHELKETFGSLNKFLKLHEDSFLITEAVNKADDIVSLSGKESCIKQALLAPFLNGVTPY